MRSCSLEERRVLRGRRRAVIVERVDRLDAPELAAGAFGSGLLGLGASAAAQRACRSRHHLSLCRDRKRGNHHWERGAGETQASGSSSCAAASAAIRLGLVKSPVTVKMPGGQLNIEVAADFSLTMKGPVAEVARGSLSPSFVRSLR